MKRRWKILIAAGIFLVLVSASLLVTMHVQPQNEVVAYKKMLLSKGEKLALSEVVPPHVPDESNGAPFVISAFSLFVPASEEYSNLPMAMSMVAEGRAIVGWAQTNVVYASPFGFTNSWANIEAVVEDNRPAVDLLTQAAGYPALDFQVNYAGGPP